MATTSTTPSGILQLTTGTGAGQGTSSSWQTASTALQATPQSTLSLAIAKAAEGLGNTFYQWATNQLPADAAITGQTIGNYFNASKLALGSAQQYANQYTNTYAPEMQQLANTAGEYSSAARQRVNAGRATADVMQGSNAAKQQNMQALQEYGINPSAGVYQELAQSNNTLAGAAGAAAGTTAATNTEAAGRQLLGQSVGVGETLPGAEVNALNTGIGAASGAENAQLANTTTGAQALQSPNAYFQTAQSLTPEQATSTSAGGSTSQQTSANNTFGDVFGGVHTNSPTAEHGGAIPEYVGGGGVRGAKVMHPKDMSHPGHGSIQSAFAGGKGGKGGRGHGGRPRPPNPYQGGGGNPPRQQQNGSAGNQSPNTAHDTGYPTAHDIPSSGDSANSGGSPMMPRVMQQQNAGSPGGATPSAIPAAPDMSGGADSGDPSAQMGRGGAMPGAMMHRALMMHKQQHMADGGAAAQDSAIPNGPPSGGIDGSQAVGGPSTGGFVSHSLSPTKGQQTDDVPARLNAGEFVVPRDVAAWKGQEFFQKMIMQSRQALQSAQAMPTMGAA